MRRIVLLALLAIGCASGRTAQTPPIKTITTATEATLPAPQRFLDPCYCEPSDRVEYPWAEIEVHKAMQGAIDKLRPWFDSGRLAYRRNAYDWTALEPAKIEVNFQACDFWVPSAKFYSGGVCASGLGDGNWKDMFISVRWREKVPALLEWEMGNVILRYFGRDDWTDLWHRLEPDPDWKPAPPKRRSVGR